MTNKICPHCGQEASVRNLAACLKQMSKDIQEWPQWKKDLFGDAFPKFKPENKENG